MTPSEQLAEKIKEITLAFWQTNSLPLLLSNLPRELRKTYEDYKAVLGTNTLKQFVLETGPQFGYKVIEHPNQRAKIGIVPIESKYEFPAHRQPQEVSAAESDAGPIALVGFVRKLAELPPEDLEKILIPASVLVKLLD